MSASQLHTAGSFRLKMPRLNRDVSQNKGYRSGGPLNEDYNISGSILESPHFGKLPY